MFCRILTVGIFKLQIFEFQQAFSNSIKFLAFLLLGLDCIVIAKIVFSDFSPIVLNSASCIRFKLHFPVALEGWSFDKTDQLVYTRRKIAGFVSL
ncbi:hypothetical protein QVD17_18890 [Tagetes erecta]|uniref:Uncharacterized protein n=1 Tax=Tagetes erecta TaxID=13708 RepID=A0AAD8NWR3_TARER|nr:hypothetical protein QVD17_18890 [Tagetes erecta]